MLCNRSFRVFINNKSNRPRRLNDGLAQGSVCAPDYSNVYTSDMPVTLSKKFLFTDDLGLATQVKTFEQGEQNLEQDLNTMSEYYRQWGLCLNKEKAEVTIFHLDNRSASKKLNVFLNGSRLTYNMCPTYLGVPLGRILTFKQALEQRAKKLKMRNNLLQKLAGAHWGVNGNVLRTAALSLVYSAAEYASTAWYRSRHTDKIDRREWKMLNSFRSGHGCSADWMFKWKFKDSPYCDCEPNTIQTMEHVLQFFPLRKFDGDLKTQSKRCDS